MRKTSGLIIKGRKKMYWLHIDWLAYLPAFTVTVFIRNLSQLFRASPGKHFSNKVPHTAGKNLSLGVFNIEL
jgi:hypothetical protein